MAQKITEEKYKETVFGKIDSEKSANTNILKRIKTIAFSCVNLEKESEKNTALKETLDRAWEIRKFEIEMYWKRANHFWLFIAATLIAYTAHPDDKTDESSIFLSLLICIVGFTFSVAFYWVRKLTPSQRLITSLAF